MTNIKMKATDTLHISSVGPDNIAPGGEFEVSSAIADDLEARGLAKRVGAAKAEASAPENKMEPAAENKAAVSAATAPTKAKRKGR